ncbi:MAG: FtsX-like permease family protein [Hyphomicrobiaceae bacterium]
MRSLDKKLIRDLRRMWAQVLAIAAVIAAGIATLILASGAYNSLYETRDAYYERHRFADVFANLKRAPKELLARIREIPGVVAAEPRIVKLAIAEIEGLAEPASAIAISRPDHGEPRLNTLYLRRGRLPEPGRVDQVTVNESFAKAHRFDIGSTFKVILNGRKREVTIVGIALSPEYIYALGPGDLMPDDRRFAVIWMSEKGLAGLFDLEGAFNEVSLKLLKGASEADVIARLDSLLARYGGAGAFGRKDQQSHAFLDAELRQLAAMARIVPPIFLAVSAFLINMTLMRLVSLEREQIGLLKALGYAGREIAWHYAKLVLAISALGTLAGCTVGYQLGNGLTRLYGDFFHFPFLIFERDPAIYVIAALVAALAAIIGAMRAVGGVVFLPPAVAMQAPVPQRYKRVLSKRGLEIAGFSQLTVMALRHIVRRPVRAALTGLGIALAVSLLITAFFTLDSVEHLIDVTFFRTDRQDATLNFSEVRPDNVVQDVRRLPGVMRAEPFRAVAVRLRKGHRFRQLSIVGKPKDMELSRILDSHLQPVRLPSEGLVVSERVAEVLRVSRGDIVEVDVLEGRRRTLHVPVVDIVKMYFGLAVYMDIEALGRVMQEGRVVSGVHIAYDASRSVALYRAIKNTPVVTSVGLQRVALTRFRETIAQNINIMTSVYIALSMIIAFGVVYNSARVQLSERARELASLRVMGFTRLEVSRVLVTELVLLTLLAQPFGWWIGQFFAWLTVEGFSSDLYRIPFVIERATYARATLVVLVAAVVSILIVRSRVDRLDLIGVLKTRE